MNVEWSTNSEDVCDPAITLKVAEHGDELSRMKQPFADTSWQRRGGVGSELLLLLLVMLAVFATRAGHRVLQSESRPHGKSECNIRAGEDVNSWSNQQRTKEVGKCRLMHIHTHSTAYTRCRTCHARVVHAVVDTESTETKI